MSAKKDLIGTWRLVSIENRRSSGKVIGLVVLRNPTGMLTYNEAGYMSVQIMSRDRSPCALSEPRLATTREKEAAYEGYLAYYGTYEVDEREGTVSHHVEGSLFPNWVGTLLKRSFKISGDQLTLDAIVQGAGESLTSRLIWERAKRVAGDGGGDDPAAAIPEAVLHSE